MNKIKTKRYKITKYKTKKHKTKKHKTLRIKKGGGDNDDETQSKKRMRENDEKPNKKAKTYDMVNNRAYRYSIMNEDRENKINFGTYTGPWYNVGVNGQPYSIGIGTFTSTPNTKFNGITSVLNHNNDINIWEYKGRWLNGKPDTSTSGEDAILTINDGNITYKGQFKEGNMDGLGELTINNNESKYVGEFKFSKINGEGKLTTPNYTYEGQFINNKKNGKGVYKSGNVIYEGNFVRDRMEGYGKLENTLFIYTGQFENNKINGKGIMYIKRTKVKMDGKFTPAINRQAAFNFNGEVTYPDTSKYIGQLINFQKIEGETEGEPNSLANQRDYDVRFGMVRDPTSLAFDMEYL
jgi:hypothetical protein